MKAIISNLFRIPMVPDTRRVILIGLDVLPMWHDAARDLLLDTTDVAIGKCGHPMIRVLKAETGMWMEGLISAIGIGRGHIHVERNAVIMGLPERQHAAVHAAYSFLDGYRCDSGWEIKYVQ